MLFSIYNIICSVSVIYLLVVCIGVFFLWNLSIRQWLQEHVSSGLFCFLMITPILSIILWLVSRVYGYIVYSLYYIIGFIIFIVITVGVLFLLVYSFSLLIRTVPDFNEEGWFITYLFFSHLLVMNIRDTFFYCVSLLLVNNRICTHYGYAKELLLSPDYSEILVISIISVFLCHIILSIWLFF